MNNEVNFNGLTCMIRGPALIEFLDNVEIPRIYNGPFIMPIADKMKDMGTVVMGKIESGRVKKGQKLQIMPNKVPRLQTTCFFNSY